MTTKIIPQSKVVTCDSCGRVCGKGGETPRVRETTLILKRHALDMHGDPAADGSLSFDFCDGCASNVETSINAAVAAIRAGLGAPA